jgi:hypothetical protein
VAVAGYLLFIDGAMWVEAVNCHIADSGFLMVYLIVVTIIISGIISLALKVIIVIFLSAQIVCITYLRQRALVASSAISE